MINLIIEAALCIIFIIAALYAYKRDIKATEKLKHVEEREKRLRMIYERPFCYRHKVDLDNHKVIVGCKWLIDSYMQDGCIKDFPFNPDDVEDMAFAIREAEELIDKLKEK